VEIHPDTGKSLNIPDGDWVWIETKEDRVKMRAKYFNGIAEDVVCAQHAWWFPEKDAPEYGWKESNVNLSLATWSMIRTRVRNRSRVSYARYIL
jgi:anaerobic selenocysteine-containing dehydrogenase